MPRRRGLEAAGQQAELQAVEQPRAVFLVQQQVAEVRQRHPADARPVGVHPQRRLLGHDPGREERRRLDAEQLDQLRLKPPDRAGLAVDVPLLDAKLVARPRQVRQGPGRRAEDLPGDGVGTGPRGDADAGGEIVGRHDRHGRGAASQPCGWRRSRARAPRPRCRPS